MMGAADIVFLASFILSGVRVQAQVQVVPQGIASINGSAADMGCTSQIDSGGVVVCNCSYLVDGISPSIDTSTSDWASQLVTVRRNEGTADVPFAHVLLTFGFDTAVTLTRIEIVLFNCSDWNIGAPSITLYLNPEYDLVYIQHSVETISLPNPPIRSSCNSLSTVTFSGGSLGTSYRTFHVLVDLTQHPLIQWLHVAEVRFIGTDVQPSVCLLPHPTSTMTPSPPPPSLSSSHATTTSLSPSFTRETTQTPLLPSTQVSLTTLSALAYSPSLHSAIPDPPPSPFHSPTPKPPSPPTPDSLPSSPRPDLPQTTSSSSALTTNILRSASAQGTTARPGGGLIFTTRTTALPILTTTIISSTPEPDNQPLFTRTTTILTAAVAAGMLILVLMTLVFVIYCCVSRKRQAKEKKATQSSIKIKASSLNDVDPGSLSATTNPIQYSFSSPLHEQYNAAAVTVSDSHYEGVVSRRRQQEGMEGSEYSYAYVSLSEAKTKVRYSSSFKYDYIETGHPSWSLRRPQEKLEPRKVEAPTAPLPLYSNIPNAASPTFVPKLEISDSESSPPSPDEVVVSERIDPSDFMYLEKSSKGEGTSQVYGPVYPSLDPMPGRLPPLRITRDYVMEINEGTGEYGSAVLAVTRGLSLKDMRLSKDNTDRDLSILLALKKLRPHASQDEQEAFDREVEFMYRLKHPNVVQFIGVCYENPTFLMMEYMEEGDLNQFLHRYSEIVPTTPSSETQITTQALIYMAAQIASGMKHLSNLKFIHRDLATRKCFVGSNFTVKLADFGTNTRYLSHYYRIRGNILMPIRWMATECFYGKFSEKTDVWAFGVTMWELFTLAKEIPYSRLSDEEVVQNALKREYRRFPSMPAACPHPVYELMKRCWCLELKQRATFEELEQTLRELK